MKQINFFKSIFYRLRNYTAFKSITDNNPIEKHVGCYSQSLYKKYPAPSNGVLQPPVHALVLRRYFSVDSEPPPQKLNLSDFHKIVWPSIIKSMKNWIQSALIVRPYFDPDFHLGSFVEGAKQAAEVVSNYLAEGKLDELEGLLTAECIAEIKRNLALLSVSQRAELSIKKNDIYFSFPYELGVIFDDDKPDTGNPQKRHVELTVVHHVLRGHSEMIDRGEPIPLNIGVLPEYRDKIFILNYRFIRNYTKGVEDQWTLNVVNHFKPTEFD